ncbi:MAG: hypothetical protein KDA70_11625 [Planctomycetaceae bacterium]|nr:hypothetical protein [Planctomycetaceae bacterium]MCA9019943.1 hypothetical protein [Planctomycetaceae bacterium]
MIWTKSVKELIVLCAIFTIFGCGNSEPKGGPRAKTVPLTGTVLVDGKPEEGVTVSCHPVNGGVNNRVLSGTTDASGKVFISTYVSGDGVPPGEYTLTFKWVEKGPGSEKDLLKGRYTNPEKSEHKVTATEGQAADLNEINLKTK